LLFPVSKLLDAARDGRQNSGISTFVNVFKTDVNSRHDLGWTSLQVAAVHGNASTVKLLLALGADPDLKDEFTSVAHMSRTRRLNSLEGTAMHLTPSSRVNMDIFAAIKKILAPNI